MESSIWLAVGRGLLRRNVYSAITMPGVQKPHWLPCILAMRSWTGCKPPAPRRVPPMPSTVVTAQESTEHSGARQALTERWTTRPCSNELTMTVQAPQPPSPQPSLVPDKPRERRNARRVTSGWTSASSIFLPFTKSSMELRKPANSSSCSKPPNPYTRPQRQATVRASKHSAHTQGSNTSVRRGAPQSVRAEQSNNQQQE